MFLEKLILENIGKKLRGNFLIQNISIGVKDGEIKVILGASGSGKTTILNIIAGLIQPDTGRVVIDGKDMTQVRIEDRNLGFVFQDLGLFYSMSVAENISYGLRLRKMKIEEINEKVLEIANRLSISNQLKKYPSNLSGGEKQLVALARTLVTEPAVILMDEPLSSLDTYLRNNMRWYLRSIRDQFNATIVYVTHDMEDAAILGDSIAILDSGRIIQDGPKNEIFSRPRNETAAKILGYNIFSRGGKKYAIHPERIVSGGKVKFRVIYAQTGIGYNYLVDTEFGKLYVRTSQPIDGEGGLSLDYATELEQGDQ